MSSEHIQAFRPAIAPGAQQLGPLRIVVQDRVARFGQAVWRFLEAHGRRRSARDLLALAERWKETNPTLARELRSYARGGSSY